MRSGANAVPGDPSPNAIPAKRAAAGAAVCSPILNIQGCRQCPLPFAFFDLARFAAAGMAVFSQGWNGKMGTGKWGHTQFHWRTSAIMGLGTRKLCVSPFSYS